LQQTTQLHVQFDALQLKHGDRRLNSIYGAGKIDSPKLMLIFMNPTARNIASSPEWKGLRAPWLGTKQIWSLFLELELLAPEIFNKIQNFKPGDWTVAFAEEVYRDLEAKSVYVTNLAKCTQADARPLTDRVFKDYLALMYAEIELVKPQKIITFGNQVSTVLLKKPVSVSKYPNTEMERLELRSNFDVYPVYYPVGQGRRNQPLAVTRIKKIRQE
jgi:hypothetical protein